MTTIRLASSQVGHLTSFLDALVASAKHLHLTGEVLQFASKVGEDHLRLLVEVMEKDEDIFEHVAATLGDEALTRAEAGVGRLFDLAQILPSALPPELAKKYLLDAVECYLLNLDHQCVAMCRAALEVLVEELRNGDDAQKVGRAIADLKKRKTISAAQARDMWTINDQAKEVLHAEPGAAPPDARDCLARLARLLAQLHPGAA